MNYLLCALAGTCIIAFWGLYCFWRYNRTLQKQIQEADEQRRQAIEIAQFSERRRIQKEWHDDLGNELMTMRLLLDTLPTEDQSRRQELVDSLEQFHRRFKAIVRDTTEVEWATVDGIEDTLRKWRKRLELGGIQFTYNVFELNSYNTLATSTKRGLYRITQALVSNAVEHASPQKIVCNCEERNRQLVLSITDWVECGSGVQVDTFIPRTVEQRVNELGGQLRVETSENGSCVEVSIPLQNG